MPQYKDIDAILNSLPDDLPYKASVKRVLIQATTADVVPKSEVEVWKSASEQLYKEMSERMLEERKIERKLVAREIFEEIEKLISSTEYTPKTRRKTIEVEELKEQVDWVLHEGVPQLIAELKKKYTESEDTK